MSKIKVLDNYHLIREMFRKGENGDINFYTKRVGINERTFYRLLKYLEIIDGIKVEYNKRQRIYYMKEVNLEDYHNK